MTAQEVIKDIDEKAMIEMIKAFDNWRAAWEAEQKVKPSRYYGRLANYCFILEENRAKKEN